MLTVGLAPSLLAGVLALTLPLEPSLRLRELPPELLHPVEDVDWHLSVSLGNLSGGRLRGRSITHWSGFGMINFSAIWFSVFYPHTKTEL
jgi:hypothetical protein